MNPPETGSTQQGWVTYLTLLGSALLGLCFATPGAYSNPSGASVRFGDVRLERSGNQLRVFQGTDRAIIDWNDFSIRGGESTRFRQPRSASAVLNRVRGGDLSRIDGSLLANGNVFLLNPSGIVVGKTGVIDTGGFVGSTLDISDDEFLAGGDLNFRGSSQAGIVNLGTISAAHGDVFLMAATVDNSGFIRAPRGTVGLAAGNDILLKESGEERVFVRGASGGRKENGVVNKGDIEANVAELKSYGGNIYGMAVKNEGRVAATGVSQEGGQLFLRAGGGKIQSTGTLSANRPASNSGGNIVVDAGAGGQTKVGGTVDASGSEGVGGSVILLGNEIEVMADSLILADGGAHGGRIYIGGGREGLDPRFSNATDVTVGNGAVIDASANVSGDGGEIIVFASRDLTFSGFAAVRGGADSGDGGFVELSGKRNLVVPSLLGAVSVSAANGKGGKLLIDPNDIDIVSGTPNGSVFGSPESNNLLYDSDISAFLQSQGDLEIKTNLEDMTGSGDIRMNTGSNIVWTSASNLSFQAFRDFIMEADSTISSDFNGAGGGVTVSAGRSVAFHSPDGESTTNGATIQTIGGDISVMNTLDFGTTGFGVGIEISEASITTENGNIELAGMGGDGTGLSVGYSNIQSTGTGNVTLKGTGNAMGADGTTVAFSTIQSNSGTVSVGGGSGQDAAGVRANYATFQTESGKIDIHGTGGSGDATGVLAGNDTTFVANMNNAMVEITGKGSGDGLAIDISRASESAITGVIVGDGTQSTILRSMGGDVDVVGVEGASLALDDQTGGSSYFSISDSLVGQISSNLVGSVYYESSQSGVAIGNMSATDSISINAISNVSLEGAISAGTMVEFVNTDTAIINFYLENGSSIDAPQIRFDGGTPGNSSRVTTYRDLDITGHEFVSIDEVQAGTSMLKLTGPASGANIAITDFDLGLSEIPGDNEISFAEVSVYSMPAALIDGVYFTYFDEISGGDSADSFLIDLQSGNDFYGLLSGGGGNDSFQIVEGGGGILGTLDAGDGFDTLDFSLFNTGIDVTYGNPMFPQIANALAIEKVIGTSAQDTLRGAAAGNSFRITSNNAGEINSGQFESFENLVGGGGNDVFTFLNQATVHSVAGGNGSDLLWIDDRNLGGINTYTISEGQISRNPVYNFGGIEVVQLSLGNGNDTVVTGPFSFAQVLDGGGGNDTLILPGGRGLGTNPIQFTNGQPIVHSNFENPSGQTSGGNGGGNNNGGGGKNPSNPTGADPGTILTQQIDNDNTGGPQGEGSEQNNFNSTPTSDNGSGNLLNNIFSGSVGAFSAAIAGQATVILVDGTNYLVFAPASLDGTFSLPPIIVISQLKENTGIDVFAELAEAIGYDGPALLIYSDGPYAIDLSGPPDVAIQNLLSQLLDPDAAGELFAALEMSLAIPITSEDGVVSILTVPVQPGAATIATLTEILNDASLAELTAALDG